MKESHLYFLVIYCALTACGSNEQKSTQTLQPVKVGTVESRTDIRKDFSGIVEAVDFVKLAFRVSGQIIELPIVEGQRVEKGQLIAAIDTRDIALQYAADKASYLTAAAQVERNKRLLSKQAISVQEFEISEANYQRSKSAYELSVNNLRDARLIAPFAGSIEKKLAENYQRVSSGVSIVQLVDTKKLRIKFTIPDNYLYLLQANKMSFGVEFDTYRGKIFNARLEEFLDISTDGTGIPVTLLIDDPKFKQEIPEIKPGFTCSVHLEANIGSLLTEGMTIIPLSALFQSPGNSQTNVWVVSNNNKVNRREVTVYSPTGDSQVFISKGLSPGENIIVAGVYQLTEGEQVKTIK
ncbi:MAG: efflux RND transporter periplasmic adaptor subunit [Bacteroides sp.]